MLNVTLSVDVAGAPPDLIAELDVIRLTQLADDVPNTYRAAARLVDGRGRCVDLEHVPLAGGWRLLAAAFAELADQLGGEL